MSKSFLNKTLDFLNNNFVIILFVMLVFIAGYLFGSINRVKNLKQATPTQEPTAVNNESAPLAIEKAPAVSESDHIIGASNPKVTIVDYSDFGCGFSARVHETIAQLVEAYPTQIAWVYRSYPLNPSGPSRLIAEAAECVASTQGNDAYWNFTQKYYQKLTTESVMLNEDSLLAYVKELGYSNNAFLNCFNNKEQTSIIDEHVAGGKAVGIKGTPFLIIFSADGRRDSVAGAAPYEDFVQKIEQYL